MIFVVEALDVLDMSEEKPLENWANAQKWETRHPVEIIYVELNWRIGVSVYVRFLDGEEFTGYGSNDESYRRALRRVLLRAGIY